MSDAVEGPVGRLGDLACLMESFGNDMVEPSRVTIDVGILRYNEHCLASSLRQGSMTSTTAGQTDR